MVTNRDFEGFSLEKTEQEDGSIKLKCEHYTIIVLADNAGFMVFDTKGTKVYDSAADTNAQKNKLQWPGPWTNTAYALVDSPRFFAPEWGVSPCCPPGVDLDDNVKMTNGFDFSNDVDGDTYVFITTGETYAAARKDFLRLSGDIPVLPDYAFGTWFTWWHFYDEGLAKSEVSRWDTDKVPLDVWGLDMNWRFTEGGQDREYNRPNTSAFINLGEWFQWLKDQGVHTYFNDHPGQSGPQTSPGEIGFRWNGLTQWLAKGLSFWWFDHNWKYSIGPPNVPAPMVAGPTACADWKGLSTTVWGSYVYYSITERYNKYMRADDTFAGGRPISLSMNQRSNQISGYSLANPLHTGSQAPPKDAASYAEHPAHHRFPVHWNGDFTTMNNDLEMMVDSGVHHFKPYMHGDCGGDGWFKGVGELIRQTQMCAFGPILRYHGGPHQPWIYGRWWEKAIRKYINFRYKMLPMIIAGGQRATATGFPLVARCDLYWPEHAAQSNSNHQYMFLDDILVAPIVDASVNFTSRKVWIPPGEWRNVWDGTINFGPTVITNGQPWERQPMWIRMDGGMLVMTDKPGLRVADGDWSTLVVDAYPCSKTCSTTRTIYERSTGPHPASTNLTLSTSGSKVVRLEIGPGVERAWVLRLNLRHGQQVASASVDGESVASTTIHAKEFDDGTPWSGYYPFGGSGSFSGSPPPSKAGPVVEIPLESSAAARVVKICLDSPDSFEAAPATDPAGAPAAAPALRLQ
jgi:hypothetical protein